MKLFLLILITGSTLFGRSGLEHASIKYQDFNIVIESYDIYSSKGEVMKLYRGDKNNDFSFVLSLILKDRTGTCSDQRRQDGSYEINGTKITLYSFWTRKGEAYRSPYGVRIQRYKILPDHTVKRIDSKVYIETDRRNYDEESGMKYLFTSPKNTKEKEALQDYVKYVEQKYKGSFVYGEEAKKLIREVKEALARKNKNRWQ